MKLGVNIDHIATLRNARGQDNPNLINPGDTVSFIKINKEKYKNYNE